MLSFRIMLAGAIAAYALPAFAQSAHPPRDFKTYQPSIAATRIDSAQAPVIDGDLSDPVWKKATTFDEFYQLEPHEGQPASEYTVVKMAYDQDNLYFAIYAHDKDPSAITAKIKARDGAIDKDDIIRIYLDPNMTRRNGYIFEINPLGARREGLLQNNTDVLYNWNTLWSAKAKIVSDGWVVEVAIPFRSISYDPSRHDWGFDFFRLVRRKNERIRWSAINIAITSADISHSGTLTGIHDIREGFGLDAQLYAVADYDRIWDKPGDADFSIKPSGNIYYKITPGLTGLVTFNTDFSDTPLDARKVNITRFALFYPETRDFFLQDAAAFEFGGLNLDPNADPNGQPFFSRNIGLVNLAPVNLQIGGKLSGEIGDFNIGALSVRTGKAHDGTPPQILSAARATMPVLDESKLGLIFTRGDPTGLTRNTLGGGDFQYRNSNLFGGKTLQVDAYYERSSSSAVGDDNALGFEASFPNEPWNGYFRFKEIGSNFDPALGFVSRAGIRNYNGQVVRRIRFTDSDVRWYETGTWWDWTTGLDNTIQSRLNGAWVGTFLNSGDFGMFEDWVDYERVAAPFDLPNNVLVPAGNYQWNVGHFRVETADARAVKAIVDVQCCGFYDGTLLQTDISLDVKPNDTFDIQGEHIMDMIRLPTGNVTIHIASLNLGVNFTPDMQLQTQAQYDNISQVFGFSLRYRWEFLPGSELLIAAGDAATLDDHANYTNHETQLVLRVGHTFRV